MTDRAPSGGTDYFTRIREGESNMEWVQMVGTLTITNKVAGSNEVVKLVTPDGTVPRMTLMGDHSWRYHYQVPTNAIGGKLSFKLVAKEYYTNATDATTWLTRTNELYTVEETVTDIPYTATLLPSNPNEISVILDDASTHLKIEYNDEQGAFSLSHASYQSFNLWTDARDGFRGNYMETNGVNAGVSNSGVSDNKKPYYAPFDDSWELCPEQNTYWRETFTAPVVTNEADREYIVDEWFSVHKTPNGWTAHNSRFVEGARGDDSNLALALDGLGEGALAMENFSKDELPLGLDSVNFTARIAQPIQFDDFATYMDGLSCTNYAISAMITMSRQYEDTSHKPDDMSPVYPAVSFVGYHRGKQGCYEFRMTRKTDTVLKLELYKWTRTGSGTKPILLKSTDYTANMLVAKTSGEVGSFARTAAYFLVYTLSDGTVKLEGHLSSGRTAKGTGITGDETGLAASSIAFVDASPGVLARGGSYGVGSTDCRAGFGAIRIHSVAVPPTASTATSGDAVIMKPGTLEGRARLQDEWDYYESRWEVDPQDYDPNGGLSGVVPSNQVVEVWLSDAEKSGSGWVNTGYSVTVHSFSTNMFTVSPRMTGSWKVRLQTGQDEDAGVVVDDVEITPWEGVERWGRNGSAYQYQDDWVYTKAWIAAAANITLNNKPYSLPQDCVLPVGTNGYVFIFKEPGTYTFEPTSDMVIDRALLVGGGGAGGWTIGGGGGGGGVVEGRWENDPATVPADTMIQITVGAGGNNYYNSNNGSGNWRQGTSGGSTSLSGIPGKSLTAAKGGGAGGMWNENSYGHKYGLAGGSGGGGSNSNAGGNGTSGQGFNGGKANGESPGGGGGAGEAGQDGIKNTSGNNGQAGKGGDGLSSDITGEIVYYGGGGGGGGGNSCGGPNKTSEGGGAGGLGGGGRGANRSPDAATKDAAEDGVDGLGGGGGGGGHSNGNAGGKGGCGTVILRVTSATRHCVLQPSRGKDGYPMGLRSPYIDEGMSLFTYSYQNADSNCVLLVQVATNMTPSQGSSTYVPSLTESLATNGEDVVWTTIARHDFSTMTTNELAGGTMTTFISLRQHWIYDINARKEVYTNVCGVIRVIVDPDIVSNVVNAARDERDDLVDYGKITITKAYCYNEPALNMRSWFGWNVHTEGWDGMGGSGEYAYLTDWPDGLSIALNFSALMGDNTSDAAKGIGLGEPDKESEYKGQNPFIQCAALTNGIGTVSFRARLFDTNETKAVITLYGGKNASDDQVQTESATWDILTNFVVTSSTYQPFEWETKAATSPYQAIRLEAAGARHGRKPSMSTAPVGAWEWGNISPRQEPINRVFIDEVSVSELIVPRLKFLDVRPFREHLGSEDICVITNIMKAEQQPLILESWGIQCRLEPQQMADELDTDTIRVWMEVFRGKEPWGYEQWKDLPKDTEAWINGQKVTVQQRFTSELQRVSESNLVYRSYYLFPESILPPEEEPNTVYQYVVRATYRDKSGSTTEYPAILELSDWEKPEWYRGSDVGAGNDSGDPAQFSAFTILDSISPRRAWINEVNICDALDTKGIYQFLEFAVPQGADLQGWKVVYTDYDKRSATLFEFGLDEGVRTTKKAGNEPPTPGDHTNHYAFVSVCAPQAKGNVKNDGYWKKAGQFNVIDGAFQYYLPYGIQLVRPSNIIEHEIVVQGTNMSSGVSWGSAYSGTNLTERLRESDPESQWFYAGEDLWNPNTTLGVFRSHGEDGSCWTNYMKDTSTVLNQLKDGTLQVIPYGYFIEPLGGNVWIYSTLLKPNLLKQFYGGRDMGASSVIVVPAGTSTNIVLAVTNWYQIGTCTTNDVSVPGAQGSKGTYTLHLNSISNTVDLLVDVEPDDTLARDWGLTPENSYTPAVMAWLYNEYPGYNPEDLSQAIYRDLSGTSRIPLTLTEMYWLNIPPVHADPICGGSNIWFRAGMGSLVSGGEPDVDPHVETLADGTIRSNVFMTVTMMITNTATGAAWPPDRLNGQVYDGQGSSAWAGGDPPWTGSVFNIVGALQKPDVATNYYPLQQYTFKPGSFGAADDPQHPFQTRVEVSDPYVSNLNYGWSIYRNVYPVWYRWVIKPRPDDFRISTVPLVPNWTPATGP